MRQTKKNRTFAFCVLWEKKPRCTCVSFDAFYVIWLRGDSLFLDYKERVSDVNKRAGAQWGCFYGAGRVRLGGGGDARSQLTQITRGARVYLLTRVLACISLLLVRPIRIYEYV